MHSKQLIVSLLKSNMNRNILVNINELHAEVTSWIAEVRNSKRFFRWQNKKKKEKNILVRNQIVEPIWRQKMTSNDYEIRTAFVQFN